MFTSLGLLDVSFAHEGNIDAHVTRSILGWASKTEGLRSQMGDR